MTRQTFFEGVATPSCSAYFLSGKRDLIRQLRFVTRPAIFGQKCERSRLKVWLNWRAFGVSRRVQSGSGAIDAVFLPRFN